MWLATLKVEQHTMSMKQGLIKLRVGLLQPITANIASGDFDISQRRGITGQSTGMADLRGDGEFIMKIRRFIPDFISQTGNTQVTLQLRNFPNDSQASSSLDLLQFHHLHKK